MADAPRIESRLAHLDDLLGELDEIREGGRAAYEGSLRLRLATWHGLQLAIQACIDIAGNLLARPERGALDAYKMLFTRLEADGLDPDLAARLRDAAGLRNVLVHDYLELDDDIVWESLGHLDDLRDFAAFVGRRLD